MSGSQQTNAPTYDPKGFLGQDPNAARLYDNVQVMLPAVGLPLLQMMLWNTIEDFYLTSTSKRVEQEFQLPPGVQQVDFNPYDETWLVAWVLGVKGIYRPKIVPPGVVIDQNSPEALRRGVALLALKPNSFQATMPPELWQQWFDTILNGVLMRLCMMPSKPWTSPQMALTCGKIYRRGMAQARDIAQREWTDGAGRWSFAQFQGYARGRRKS